MKTISRRRAHYAEPSPYYSLAASFNRDFSSAARIRGSAYASAVRSAIASLLVTRPFTHMHTLTVAVNGPANSGTVSSAYAPTSKRQLNKAYSILATLETGFVFDGWTINDMAGAGVSAAQAELPTLSFTMRKGLVLVAKFITNPFNSAVTGSYSGLIAPSPLHRQVRQHGHRSLWCQ